VATFIQLIGFIVITVGVWLAFPPAAVIIAGLFTVAFGVAWERVNNAGSNTKA
jgi:hypothetical protein